MHVCRGAFRRRNSLLHEVDEVDEATEADGANEADKIIRRSR